MKPEPDDRPHFFESLREGIIIPPATGTRMSNPSWETAAARILIVRLSPWRDVDISTSHLVLFDEVRSAMPDAYIDFAFMPTASDRRDLSAKGISWFFGRASRHSPRDFNLLMVSNAFALELVNLPYLFTTSGMPVSARERVKSRDLPIAILGGSNASATGCLVDRKVPGPAADSIMDGLFFGEGEGAIGPLAKILAGEVESDLSRDKVSRLKKAASISGFWPCLYSPGAARAVFREGPRTIVDPLALNGESASTVRLSITSGCPGYCSFCLEGWERRPYREASYEDLISTARKLRVASGANELEIYSFNFNTHSRVFDLILELNKIYQKVSFMSQRLDILAGTRGLVEAELAGGKRSFTLGIEGISSRMRAYYRKGLTKPEIEACLNQILRPGVKELKLFFIVAGTETQQDIDEFTTLMSSVGERARKRGAGVRVLVSAGFLVRLPFTPLQFAALEMDAEKLDRIAARLRYACEDSGLEFRLASDMDEYLTDQILSIAGSAIFSWLAEGAEKGHIYDSSLSKGAWESLKWHLYKNRERDTLFMEKSREFRPPLEFIEEESHHATLYRHYEKATNLVDRPPCLGKTCTACDACEDAEERKRMVDHNIAPPARADYRERLEAIMLAKSRFEPLFVRVDLPRDLARTESAYKTAWLLRSLGEVHPDAYRFVFDAKESLFGGNALFSDLVPAHQGRWGITSFALFGPDPGKLSSHIHTVIPGFAVLPGKPQPSRVNLEFQLDDCGFEDAQAVFERFLDERKLPCTARNIENGRRYEFSHAASGRRVLAAARLENRRGTTIFQLEAGEKAILAPLLDDLGEKSRQRIPVRVTGWM